MTSKVVIDVQTAEISIALLEDDKLVEYQTEKLEDSYAVGNVFVAKVKKLMPGLNACFVDVGYKREAFLHYLDLGNQFSTYAKYVAQLTSDKKKIAPFNKFGRSAEMPKSGTIQGTVERDQVVLVQVQKEPISTKGPRITGELEFTGRYLILVPFGKKISVSTKIESKAERARLRQLVASIQPGNVGIIVRTAAEGKKVAELNRELKSLVGRWEETIEKVHSISKYPSLVYEEQSRVVSLLRDLFNPSYESIHVNNKQVYEEIKNYVAEIAPEKEGIVKYYDAAEPIFDHFNVTKQQKSSFGKVVSIKRGAYLIIEHTEALHVVDVNSGNRTQSEKGQEGNALEVNLGAADELARQIRLRDMGGIIVVDFIDMDLAEDRQALYERMCKNMEKDRAKHNILPLSKFGLMQITRQRVRPAMDLDVEEMCPTCFGKGQIRPSILFTDQLESKIDYVVNTLKMKRITLYVHPYVNAYINQGFFSLKNKWQMKYGLGLKVVPSQKLAFLQYELVDHKRNIIDMKEEIETK
ncbi:MAG: Rne/Rng family ribonuclease [Bacteroidaceae bacterium]|nr:Rne/Rng family ribonuclease [Bacteroidaceae bacterium]